MKRLLLQCILKLILEKKTSKAPLMRDTAGEQEKSDTFAVDTDIKIRQKISCKSFHFSI